MGKKNKKKRLENSYQEENSYINEDFLTYASKKIILFSSFFALLTPLIVSRNMFFPFIGPKSLYFMFFAEIAFFTWLILAIHNRNFLPKKNIILLSLSLYIFIFFIASIFGTNFQESFWSNHERMTGFLMHLHLFGFFIAISSTLKFKEWNIFFSLTSIVASIVSLIALYDRYVGVKSMVLRGGSTLGNTSFLGTYLLLSVFIALYIFFRNRDFYRYIGGITFVLISLGIILNQGGRAAFLSFISGIILIFLLWLFFEKKGGYRVFAGAVFIVALIISIFGFSIVLNPSSQFSENILERLNLGTIGGRTITWEISNKGFLERPMLGWGPENYYLAFAKNYDPCLGTDRCGGDTLYDRAHNFWHDNLISFGIIGSIFYFFLFFSVLFFLWKNYLNKNIGFFDAGIFTSLFGAYFIQGLTVFDVVSSLMVIFIVIAFISSLSKSEYNYKNIKEPNFVIIGIIILLSIFYINYFVINPYKSSGYVLEAFNENPNIDKKKEILEKAIYTSPLGRGHIIKNLSLRVFNKERFDSNSLKEVEFFIDEVKDELTNVPIDYNNKVILGRLYLLYVNIFIAINEKNITEEITIEALKYVDMAGEIFEEAIEISPNKQDAYWYLAETRVRQGKVEEAFSLSQKAVELEPKILNSHIYLIRIAKDILGDRELALEKVREAQEINPNWDFSPILND